MAEQGIPMVFEVEHAAHKEAHSGKCRHTLMLETNGNVRLLNYTKRGYMMTLFYWLFRRNVCSRSFRPVCTTHSYPVSVRLS